MRYPNTPTTQHPNIPTPQHPNTPINTPTPQLQLIVNYQAVFEFKGARTIPEPFATVVRIASILTLDALAVFRMDCVVADTNYYTKVSG